MYRVTVPFKFFHDGINPTEYGEGLHDLPERAAEVAIAEGWAEEATNPDAPVVKKPGRPVGAKK
jgi:hypothetical protein